MGTTRASLGRKRDGIRLVNSAAVMVGADPRNTADADGCVTSFAFDEVERAGNAFTGYLQGLPSFLKVWSPLEKAPFSRVKTAGLTV